MVRGKYGGCVGREEEKKNWGCEGESREWQ